MTKISSLLLTAAALLAASSAFQPATTQAANPEPVTQTLATYPHGAFLENLAIGKKDEITFTSYFDKTLQRIEGSSPATTFATLDVHPVGIVQMPKGYLVTAHGKAFSEGPDFTSTNMVLLLDAKGAVRKSYKAPQARFLNGAVMTPGGDVLIADSLAGVIWRLDPRSGKLSEWKSDPNLTPDPAAKGFALGANGIKISAGFVYVSNTSRQTLYRIALGASGKPKGPLAEFAKTGGIDDFAFAPDGSIYVATHQASITRVSRTGKVDTVLPTGCDGCTSLALRGHGTQQSLVVLTTGSWGEPDATTPARVFSFPMPGAH